MIELRLANPDDWQTIADIAKTTWPVAYGRYLPSHQIEYMLKLIYSNASLENQMKVLEHRFIIGLKNAVPVAFASFEKDFMGLGELMIHKLYVLPEMHGHGVGGMIMNQLENYARLKAHKKLRLQVYVKNIDAIGFYRRLGFTIVGNQITDMGNGYVIHDKVMKKHLK